MRRINAAILDSLLKVGSENDFIVLGEVHGSKQNASLVKSVVELFFKNQVSIILALEWAIPQNELTSINKYLEGREKPEITSDFFLDSDGRMTIEHFQLLKFIRDCNQVANKSGVSQIKICTFESEENSSSELELAESLESCKRENPDRLIIVETGNFHARKFNGRERSAEEVSMASRLSEKYKVCSILIKYLQGTVTVEGQKLNITESFSQQPSQESYFDVILEIPVSVAADEIIDLQSLKDIL